MLRESIGPNPNPISAKEGSAESVFAAAPASAPASPAPPPRDDVLAQILARLVERDHAQRVANLRGVIQ